METRPLIDASHPDAITYSTDELKFTILGGIRLEGLERLGVTLRTEMLSRKVPHYMHNPERLERGITPVAQALAAITRQLEHYRQQQIETRQRGPEIKKPLSETDT